MANWKVIGLCGLFSAVVSGVVAMIYFPLFFLGPLIGGFLAVYFSGAYEDYYEKMDRKDGAVIGVLSGIIGGLILGSFLVLSTGTLDSVISLINAKLGTLADAILAGYLILQLTVIVGMVFGGLGGYIGFIVKK